MGLSSNIKEVHGALAEVVAKGGMLTAIDAEPPSTSVLSRPNSHTIQLVYSYSQTGKYIGTLKREVSANGLVLTETIDLLSPKRRKVPQRRHLRKAVKRRA